MQRIVVAIDGSDASSEAVRTGIRLARASGAEVVLVAVRQTPIQATTDDVGSRPLVADTLQAERALDGALAKLAAAGIHAEAELRDGDPADQILAVARTVDADLVVVGSRGLGPLGTMLVGSVSKAVVRRADRPVLVARAQPPRRRIRRAA